MRLTLDLAFFAYGTSAKRQGENGIDRNHGEQLESGRCRDLPLRGATPGFRTGFAQLRHAPRGDSPKNLYFAN
jgi:hypothetical protein